MSNSGILDMTTGPFLKKILKFSIPLMLTGMLQLIYNAADLMVVGRFASSDCLAAVGATSSLINLIINLFIGLSNGAGVVTARHIGAKDSRKTRNCVHTAMTLSVICGIIVSLFGFFCSSFFLTLMDTPEEIIPLSSEYLKIYFIGAFAGSIYNFGASIVRATGDTKRPLFILAFSGAINVILNLILVVVFHLDVAGVAIATSVSQFISATLIVIRLVKINNDCKLSFKKLKIHIDQLKGIVKIGIPSGLQGSLFSFSNVVIQSNINSFGTIAMAGNTAAQNADALIFTCTSAVSQTAMTFSSQNMGAGKYENLRRIYFKCLGLSAMISTLMGVAFMMFPNEVLGLFTTEAAVIEEGKTRLYIMMSTYFLCGLMDLSGSQLRGMGKSLEPMIITLIGSCGLRIMWIYTGFTLSRTLGNLYLSYPLSWGITFAALIILFFKEERKLRKENRVNNFKTATLK